MPEKIGVAIIVLDKTNKRFLAGKRKNAYKAGMYGLPGGRVEMTETLIETVIRELYEETHLTAEKINYLGVVREIQEEGTFIHFIFHCVKYEGVPENAEPDKCEGWEWYDLKNMPVNMLPGHGEATEIFQHPEIPLHEIFK